MGIPLAELKKLWARSGNRCAFINCRRELVVEGGESGGLVTLGNVAHIVASSPGGPRGDLPLESAERDRYENLILLCNTHHQLVDARPQTYSAERLRAFKDEHERWVRERLGDRGTSTPTPPPMVEDVVYSTLLHVTHLPRSVFGAVSRFKTEEEVRARLGPLRKGEMAPFILRENRVFTFQRLGAHGNPFADVVQGPVSRFSVEEWASDADYGRWLMALLNRSLNKLTGRRGLALDKQHHRYYFPMGDPGEPVYLTYRPLNAKQATRAVVWQPRIRATGAPRKHWFHLAVALRFVRAADGRWCLSIRPELRATTDGIEPVPAKSTGSRVTKKKARLFNYDLLAEVQFWRDFLSSSRPQIVLPFGSRAQRLVISTELIHGEVRWPGIPLEHAKPFKNVHYLDDLFTWAEAELEGLWDDDKDGATESGGDEDAIG